MEGHDNQHARICVLEKLFESKEDELAKHVEKQEEQFKELHKSIDNIPRMIANSREGILGDISKVFSLICGVLLFIGWVYVYILKDIFSHVN